MFALVRLAGVSAVLAAAVVLATEPPTARTKAQLRPGLVVAFEEIGPTTTGTVGSSRAETRGDIGLKR